TEDEAHLAEVCCERHKVDANAVMGEEQHWWFGTVRIGAAILQVVGSQGDRQVDLDRKYLSGRLLQIWPRVPGRLLVHFPAGRRVSVDEMRPKEIRQMTAELAQMTG